MPEFFRLLGGVTSSILGYLLEVLSSLSIVVTFFIALTSTGVGNIITAVLSLMLSALEKITGDMVKADLGHGVKWQWPLYIIPGKMSAE